MKTIKDKIVELLLEQGPMTMRDIAEELRATAEYTRGTLGKIRSNNPGTLYISGYQREEVNGHLYPRAMYAVGSRRDSVRPPPLSHREYTRRYRKAAVGQANSVFALGGRICEKRVKIDWRST